MKNNKEMLFALLAGETLVNENGRQWSLNNDGCLKYLNLPTPISVEIKQKEQQLIGDIRL